MKIKHTYYITGLANKDVHNVLLMCLDSEWRVAFVPYFQLLWAIDIATPYSTSALQFGIFSGYICHCLGFSLRHESLMQII